MEKKADISTILAIFSFTVKYYFFYKYRDKIIKVNNILVPPEIHENLLPPLSFLQACLRLIGLLPATRWWLVGCELTGLSGPLMDFKGNAVSVGETRRALPLWFILRLGSLEVCTFSNLTRLIYYRELWQEGN